MRKFTWLFLFALLGVLNSAQAELGHRLLPALGVNAATDYESVVASDGSGLPVHPMRAQAADGENAVQRHYTSHRGDAIELLLAGRPRNAQHAA